MARKGKEKIKRSNDEIREVILKFFYEIYKKATSPKKMKLTITEVKRGLKNLGLESKEVMPNLEYLIQTNYIIKEEESYQVRKGQSTFYSKKFYYKASDKTINHFEGPSKFQKLDKSISGINLSNIQGVTTIIVGDANVVSNAQYVDLYKTLDILAQEIRKSRFLKDEDKLSYVGEVETIKSQLMKPKPDKNIIRQAWENLKPLATVSGIVSFFKQVAELIGSLI